MTLKALCKDCVFKRLCISKKIEGCPCKICLIKPMCTTLCKEARDYFNSTWVKVVHDEKKGLKCRKKLKSV